MVEGAALEKQCAGNGTEGSNPSLSARLHNEMLMRLSVSETPLSSETVAARHYAVFFEVCADGLAALQYLATQAATQKELSSALELSPGTVSRQLKAMEIAGLVIRPRSHAPYSLTAPDATTRFLDALSDLSHTLAVAHETPQE